MDIIIPPDLGSRVFSAKLLKVVQLVTDNVKRFKRLEPRQITRNSLNARLAINNTEHTKETSGEIDSGNVSRV